MQQLEDLGMAYLGGRLPPWFYRVFLATRTVALWKDKEHESVRPLGIRHPLLRVLHRMVVAENKVELREFLEPQQLALSPGGCNKLYFSLRMLMEQRHTVNWTARMRSTLSAGPGLCRPTARSPA